MDPVELRRRNIILPEEFPYDNGAGFIYDSANYPLLLDTLEKSGDYSEMVEWREKFNRESLEKNSSGVAGLGICTEIEDTGSQFTETARLVMDARGFLVLFTGSSPHGQGLETTLAQLVSQEMDVPLEKVRVVYGDTDLIPLGTGTFGSRSIAAGGSAAVEVARKLKAQLVENASKVMGDEFQFDFRGGAIRSSGDSMTIGDLFAKLGVTEISSSTEFRMSAPTFASGAHLCALVLVIARQERLRSKGMWRWMMLAA